MNKRTVVLYFAVLAVITFFIGVNVHNDYSADTYSFSFKQENIDGETVYSSGYLTLPKAAYTLDLHYNSDTDVPVSIEGAGIENLQYSFPAGSHYDDDNTYSFFVAEPSDTVKIVLHATDPGTFSVDNFLLKSSALLSTDWLYFAAVFFVLGLLLFAYLQSRYFREMSDRSRILRLLLAASIVFVSLPALQNEIKDTYDAWAHLYRINGISTAIADGQFPVYIYPEQCNGFGILSVMYPDFFLLIPAILHMMHVSLVVCYQSVIVSANIATAVAAFYSIKLITDSELSSVLGAVLYTISPFRVMELYNRGDAGETIALIFMPILIAGLYKLRSEEKEDQRMALLLIAVSFTGIIQSHVLSVLAGTAVILLMIILDFRVYMKKSRLIILIETAGIVILANFWYIVPFVTYYFRGLNTNILMGKGFDSNISLGALFYSGDLSSGQSMGTIGIIGGIEIALILIGIFMEKRDETESDSRFYHIMFSIVLVILFMITQVFPWKTLWHFEFVKKATLMIQFHLRFLVIGLPMLTICAAHYFKYTAELLQKRMITAVLIIIVALITVLPSVNSEITSGTSFTRFGGGISKEVLREYLLKEESDSDYQNTYPILGTGDLTVSDIDKNGTTVSFSYLDTKGDSYIDLPLNDYLGYKAVLMDSGGNRLMNLQVTDGEGYRVRVILPENTEIQKVKVSFGGTWYFHAAIAVSVITVLAIFALLVFSRLQRDKKRSIEA